MMWNTSFNVAEQTLARNIPHKDIDFKELKSNYTNNTYESRYSFNYILLI